MICGRLRTFHITTLANTEHYIVSLKNIKLIYMPQKGKIFISSHKIIAQKIIYYAQTQPSSLTAVTVTEVPEL